jgi:DNA-binding transcriptional ArsR family regulator
MSTVAEKLADDWQEQIGNQVGMSTPLELYWLLSVLRLANSEHAAELIDGRFDVAAQPGLRRRTQELWDDGNSDSTEVAIVAHATGHLLSTDMAGFVAAVREIDAIPDPGPQSLFSEDSAEHRLALRRRIARLNADAALRNRYADLLADVWAAARLRWDANRGEVDRWLRAGTTRLADGVPIDQLISSEHLLRIERYLPLLPAAVIRGQVVMAPVYFGGRQVFFCDLPNLMVIGVGTGERSFLELQRQKAADLAGQLKLLSDPTRLAILAAISTRGDRSSTDLVRLLHLSPASISEHVRQLREAGLIHPVSEGQRTLYLGDEKALDGLLSEVRDRILTLCRRERPPSARGSGQR